MFLSSYVDEKLGVTRGRTISIFAKSASNQRFCEMKQSHFGEKRRSCNLNSRVILWSRWCEVVADPLRLEPLGFLLDCSHTICFHSTHTRHTSRHVCLCVPVYSALTLNAHVCLKKMYFFNCVRFICTALHTSCNKPRQMN